MNPFSSRSALAAALALSVAAIGCSRDEPLPEKVVAPVKVAKVAPRTVAPVPTAPVVAGPVDPFGNPVQATTGPPEVLVKETLPPAGPVGTDVEAWQTGEAAFKHYASMNGFSDETTKSFFLKHIANNGDHYRLMMFGVLPGGPRYIAVKVFRDGRTEVLPDEM